MSKIKECIVICWDSAYSIRAVEARKLSGKEISVRNVFTSSGGKDDLVARLSDIFNNYEQSGEKTIIFSAALDFIVHIDIKISRVPANEIRNALAFEVERQVPLPFENLLWIYKIINKDEKTYTARVMILKQGSWDEFLSVLSEAGAKIDYFIHPAFFANCESGLDVHEISRIFDDMTKYFSAEIMAFEWNAKVNELDFSHYRFDSLSGSDCGDAYVKSVIAAAFSNDLNSEQSLPVPQKLRPVRFKFLKISFAALLILNILLVFLLCFRYSADARNQYFALKKEKASIDASLIKISQEDYQNRDIDEFIKKLSEVDAGNHQIAEAFMALSKNLPTHMWLTMFNSKGREIELTVSTRDDRNIQSELAKLNTSPDFSNVSIRNTRRERDGTIVIYIKLNHEIKGAKK